MSNNVELLQSSSIRHAARHGRHGMSPCGRHSCQPCPIKCWTPMEFHPLPNNYHMPNNLFEHAGDHRSSTLYQIVCYIIRNNRESIELNRSSTLCQIIGSIIRETNKIHRSSTLDRAGLTSEAKATLSWQHPEYYKELCRSSTLDRAGLTNKAKATLSWRHTTVLQRTL